MVGRMWTRDISRVGAQVARSLVAAVDAGPDNPILNTVHYGLLQVAKEQEVVPKQVIDPEKLVSQAYAIASRDGISALSVRKVATACGIAIGSVYAYFPTKADLTAAVLTRFFEEHLSKELCAVLPGERFTSYARRLRDALTSVRSTMSVDWFAQMRRLPERERDALEAARAPVMTPVERAMRAVLDADEAVAHARLVGPLHPERVSRLTLRAIVASMIDESDCDTLFALLEASLYPCPTPPDDKDALR